MTASTTPIADLKERVCREIDQHADSLIALAEDIFRHPELGFKETRTAGQVAARFRALGIPFETDLALTGVKGMLTGNAPGPTVAVLGELDSLIVADHPAADRTTGAAHACGHNAQIATMIGTTTGLAKSGVLAELSGRVACMAVPAEEYVEVGYRLGLREGREDRVPRRQAGAVAGGGVRRRGHGDDGAYQLQPRRRSHRSQRVLQWVRGQADHVSRPRGPRRGRAPPRYQRAQRGDARLAGDSCQPGDVPRPGHDPRASDHYARRGHRECGAGRGADGDLRPRSHAEGHHRGEPQGGSGAASRRAGRGSQSAGSRPCRAICRSATIRSSRRSTRTTR